MNTINPGNELGYLSQLLVMSSQTSSAILRRPLYLPGCAQLHVCYISGKTLGCSLYRALRSGTGPRKTPTDLFSFVHGFEEYLHKLLSCFTCLAYFGAKVRLLTGESSGSHSSVVTETDHSDSPLHVLLASQGIYVDKTYDIGRVEDVHFNPW